MPGSLTRIHPIALALGLAAAGLPLAGGVAPRVLQAHGPGADAMTELADAERAFARETAKVGIRAGFLAWFARDSIGFQPALGNAWNQISSRPAPPNPTAVLLEWEPRTGDVAASGDLGWLTGPSTFTLPDGTHRYGNYLSVWKKTPEGWRVHIDVGANAPSPVDFAPGFVRMPASAEGRWTGSETLWVQSPIQAESKAALSKAEATANASGFVPLLAEQARYHRPGSLPLVGRAAIAADADAHPVTATRTSLAVEQARSLDLGYSYGRYELKPSGGTGAAETGFYVRVWRRDASGWKIVAQVNQPDGR
jgi:hypothetical protein